MTSLNLTSRRGLLAAGGAFLALAGAGVLAASLLGPSATSKDETFMTAETAGVLNIEGGDCFTDPRHSDTEGAVLVDFMDCASADNQVYGFFQIDDDVWDRERVVRRGWDGCRVGFTSYWKDEDASGLAFYPVVPTERTWRDDEDRTVMCVVYNPRGRLEGSPLPKA